MSDEAKKSSKKTLAAAFKAWSERCLAPSLAKVPKRVPMLLAPSGQPAPELFVPEKSQLTEQHYLDRLGFPGEFPFTRGVQPSMYRAQRWSIRQYAGFGSAEDTNRRYHYLLKQGTTGLSVAFDLPTQMGRDSDHTLARGEVGRVGVAIDSVDDMDTLFAGIDLAKISTSMTINATAHILLALYIAVAKRRGTPLTALRGTVQNDVLKEYIARGTYIYPPKAGLKIVTDIFEFCRDTVPQWNTISISGYHIREAGSTAVQELAFTLADAIAYVESAVARGLEIDSFAPRLAFFFNCHNNFLEEIAKFRAARRMWAHIMRDRFGAKLDKSLMLRFHTQTAGSSLTAQEPLTNAARTTIQALAAVLGGTQSLHTNGFDEALCLPSEESALLALRTQQVIAFESGVSDVVDPLGGSFAIESLTDQLEAQAYQVIGHIDSLGGMVRAIELEFPQQQIEDAAYQYQRSIERGETVIAGINSGGSGEGDSKASPIRVVKIDPELERRQIERLQALRACRDNSAVSAALAALERDISENKNLMPSVCNAVENRVTLGEISDVLRNKFGEYGHSG